MIVDITTCPVFNSRVANLYTSESFSNVLSPNICLGLETHDNRLANAFADIITEFVFSHVIMPHVNIFMTDFHI